jgi:hypothetical protein
MALVIEISIVCDGCESRLDTGTQHLPAKTQRKIMQGAGWRNTGGRDLCPNCRAKLRGGGYTHKKVTGRL